MIYSTYTEIADTIFKRVDMKCRLEKRPKKYMFGTNNYGEVVDTINPADGDPWDIIVPGYSPLDTDMEYTIRSLEGVIIMPNGNHKLIVDVITDNIRSSFNNCESEVYKYRRLYNRICKKRGDVILYRT